MTSVSRTLSAVAVLVAVLGGATIPAFAGMAHPVCASKHHDCGAAPKMSACCCGDEQTAPSDSTPVQSRVEVSSPLCSMPAVARAVQPAIDSQALHVRRSAPPPTTLDLPTLFSSLLI